MHQKHRGFCLQFKCHHVHLQYTSALQPKPPLLKQKHILMRVKHNNQARILVASDPVTSVSLHLRNMCQPSKTTSRYTPPDPHAKLLFLPSHAHTHTNTYIHAQIHSHWNKSNPSRVHLYAVTTSNNLTMTKPMKPSAWISPAPACMCASECASSLHTHTHACTLARCLQS